MKTKLYLSTLIALLLFPLARTLLAGKALLEDDFANPDAESASANELWKVQDGRLMITPGENRSLCVLYQSTVFDDTDVRVQVMLPEGSDAAHPAGPVFWAKDTNNYYTFCVSPEGWGGIMRLVDGRWANTIPLLQNGSWKKGVGQVNELRVVTKGRQVTAYVNDKQVAQITGQPPEGGGRIGLYSESGKNRNTWQFTNWVVAH